LSANSSTTPYKTTHDGHGKDDLLTFIVEVSGEPRRDKAAKAATARNRWIPAVNNDGRFGRWAFIEVTDPWDAKNTIRAAMRKQTAITEEA
jgi:type III restriction enzyme